jgi:hypothetical protein
MNDFRPFHLIGNMKNHDTTPSSGNVHPLPLSYYIKQNIASRTTLWRWHQQGLKILRVVGRSYLCPKELTRFMESKHEEAADEAAK